MGFLNEIFFQHGVEKRHSWSKDTEGFRLLISKQTCVSSVQEPRIYLTHNNLTKQITSGFHWSRYNEVNIEDYPTHVVIFLQNVWCRHIGFGFGYFIIHFHWTQRLCNANVSLPRSLNLLSFNNCFAYSWNLFNSQSFLDRQWTLAYLSAEDFFSKINLELFLQVHRWLHIK